MLLSAMFEQYSREELEQILWNRWIEICRLENLLINCAEEMHKCNSTNTELMQIAEDIHTKWDYPKGYSIGTYNQMRLYISDLEGVVGKEQALKIRSNKYKYLSDWFDMTEPNEC